MKYTNILVPYDRSESAQRALATALEIAADVEGAKVTAYFATPVPEFESSQFLAAEHIAGVETVSHEDIAKMQREYLDYERGLLVEHLKEYVGAPVIDTPALFDVEVGQGKPSKAILDYANAHDVDLIVMGCRGLNAVAGMLGSVSYAVLRGAACPVLIEK